MVAVEAGKMSSSTWEKFCGDATPGWDLRCYMEKLLCATCCRKIISCLVKTTMKPTPILSLSPLEQLAERKPKTLEK